MAAKKKVTYKVYSPTAQFEAVRDTLRNAEQAYYLLTLQNPELDGSLEARTASAAAEVDRLQSLYDDAEKALPEQPEPVVAPNPAV